jgi:hypothetical protein
MTLIALQAPLPAPNARMERPTPSAHALPASATVAPLPGNGLQVESQDRQPFGAPQGDDTAYRKDKAKARDAAKDPKTPDPFPDLRFADPLPDLPELDLPAKAAAYQAALDVVRGDPAPGSPAV